MNVDDDTVTESVVEPVAENGARGSTVQRAASFGKRANGWLPSTPDRSLTHGVRADKCRPWPRLA